MTMLLCWQELPLNRIIRMRSGDFISNDDVELEAAYPVYGGNGFRGFTDRFNTVGPIVLVVDRVRTAVTCMSPMDKSGYQSMHFVASPKRSWMLSGLPMLFGT